MRIIKEGRKPPTEIEKTCPRCGCVFAYERGDVVFGGGRHGVFCPTCNDIIFVNEIPGPKRQQT